MSVMGTCKIRVELPSPPNLILRTRNGPSRFIPIERGTVINVDWFYRSRYSQKAMPTLICADSSWQIWPRCYLEGLCAVHSEYPKWFPPISFQKPNNTCHIQEATPDKFIMSQWKMNLEVQIDHLARWIDVSMHTMKLARLKNIGRDCIYKWTVIRTWFNLIVNFRCIVVKKCADM